MAIKEKILDFYYNIYLCLIFLRSCFVAILQKTFITPFPKKDIKKVQFSQSTEQINVINDINKIG